ncbi:MAG: UDP-N-acetylmuramoylalanine--D-glutamate ligase [Acidobacteria bacterium SCN 69-37]|nr:MAG: UDP-N-acetylmuramoylalanine--D-glutamate ligase [Acidobacteria bacterium SCN 69-37]
MTTRPFDVSGRRVVVMGAGRSGRAAVDLLLSRGAIVSLVDSRSVIDGADDLRARGVTVHAGPGVGGAIGDADLIVVSPGIAVDEPSVAAARARGAVVIGEIELAFRHLEGRVVAVTGTKGKSTTTTVATLMLRAGGVDATAGGNLGVALSSFVDASTPGTVHVVEVSSFQLETIDTFHPWIAVFVNLEPDHLDRHGSFEAYRAAKARVFQRQTADDWAVVNADDAAVVELARATKARRFDFGFDTTIVDGITVEGDMVVERRGGVSHRVMPVSVVHLPGRHLLADVLAATAVARIAGVDPEAIASAVRAFDGLEHALERVATIDGVMFVNDSKATNVIAVRRAIESFAGGVVPIMGGRDKGGAFADLRQVLRARAAGVVLIGESAALIEEAIGGVVPTERASSMEDAVLRARRLAPPEGVVVLAPGCSSFDMFIDYGARGRAFKAAVHALADSASTAV